VCVDVIFFSFSVDVVVSWLIDLSTSIISVLVVEIQLKNRNDLYTCGGGNLKSRFQLLLRRMGTNHLPTLDERVNELNLGVRD
jgi:hypothetical protein